MCQVEFLLKILVKNITFSFLWNSFILLSMFDVVSGKYFISDSETTVLWNISSTSLTRYLFQKKTFLKRYIKVHVTQRDNLMIKTQILYCSRSKGFSWLLRGFTYWFIWSIKIQNEYFSRHLTTTSTCLNKYSSSLMTSHPLVKNSRELQVFKNN